MSIFLIIHIFLLALYVNGDEKYTTKYDNIDYEEILHSERLLKNYVNCLLDKGPCSPDGKELKGVLNDAIKTDCAKCSDRQKEISKKIIRFLIDNHRDWWIQICDKYDPDHIIGQKYEEE
nr:ejaculatory bulb-specific protein 3-like [Leptinotarsa decemlineata]